jgi:hypothetical protein
VLSASLLTPSEAAAVLRLPAFVVRHSADVGISAGTLAAAGAAAAAAAAARGGGAASSSGCGDGDGDGQGEGYERAVKRVRQTSASTPAAGGGGGDGGGGNTGGSGSSSVLPSLCALLSAALGGRGPAVGLDTRHHDPGGTARPRLVAGSFTGELLAGDGSGGASIGGREDAGAGGPDQGAHVQLPREGVGSDGATGEGRLWTLRCSWAPDDAGLAALCLRALRGPF